MQKIKTNVNWYITELLLCYICIMYVYRLYASHQWHSSILLLKRWNVFIFTYFLIHLSFVFIWGTFMWHNCKSYEYLCQQLSLYWLPKYEHWLFLLCRCSCYGAAFISLMLALKMILH